MTGGGNLGVLRHRKRGKRHRAHDDDQYRQDAGDNGAADEEKAKHAASVTGVDSPFALRARSRTLRESLDARSP